MEQKITYDDRLFPDEDKLVLNIDSWSLSLYKKQERLIIEALDYYHPEPLVISRDQLRDIAQIMGLNVRRRKKRKKIEFWRLKNSL